MYDSLKRYKEQVYSGMKIGGTHRWHYDNGTWFERKIKPDKWEIEFNCIKKRFYPSPVNSGARINTKYHWFIMADQIATKIDKDSYQTKMKGYKFKIGHKRPNWRTFSYNYPEQLSYREKVIKILEDTIEKLKNEKIGLEKYTLK